MEKYNSQIIHRPASLCMPETLTEDVLIHAYDEITKKISKKKN